MKTINLQKLTMKKIILILLAFALLVVKQRVRVSLIILFLFLFPAVAHLLVVVAVDDGAVYIFTCNASYFFCVAFHYACV